MGRFRVIFFLLLFLFSLKGATQLSFQPYKLKNLESRAATGENPLAEKGKGGMSKQGRKCDSTFVNLSKEQYRSGRTKTAVEKRGAKRITEKSEITDHKSVAPFGKRYGMRD